MSIFNSIINKGREFFSNQVSVVDSDLELCRRKLNYYYNLKKAQEQEVNSLHNYYDEVEFNYNANIIDLYKSQDINDVSTGKRDFATVIVLCEGNILLLQRSNLDDFKPEQWCLPGGGIDEEDNSPVECALRELKEETAIDYSTGGLSYPQLVHRVDNEGGSIFYFLCYFHPRLTEDEIRLDEEHSQYDWVVDYSQYSLLLDLKDHLDSIFGVDIDSLPLKKSFDKKFDNFFSNHLQELSKAEQQLSQLQGNYKQAFDEYLEYLVKGDLLQNFRFKNYIDSSLGKERSSMPQIDSNNIDDFILHFQRHSGRGDSKVSKETCRLGDLNMTQGEIDEGKVLDILQDGDINDRKYLVSKDNYIIDGHHTFAAQLEQDPNKQVTIYRVNLPVKELLRRANLLKFARKENLEGESLSKHIKKAQEDEQEGVEKAHNDSYKTMTIVYRDGGGTPLKEIINKIAQHGNPGHSFEIVIDAGEDGEEKVGWDGDGPDHIKDIQVKENGEKVEKSQEEGEQELNKSFVYPDNYLSPGVEIQSVNLDKKNHVMQIQFDNGKNIMTGAYPHDHDYSKWGATQNMSKGKKEIPGYRKAEGEQMCNNCNAFKKSESDNVNNAGIGFCTMFDNTKVKSDYVCDYWLKKEE